MTPIRNRRGLARLACAVGLGIAVACALGLAGWAAPQDEKEDPNGGVKKPVVVPGPPVAAPSDPDLVLEELVEAAGKSDQPAVRALLNRFAAPFDLLIEAREKAEPLRIQPVPWRWREEFLKEAARHIDPDSKKARFTAAGLDMNGRPGPPRSVLVGDIGEIQHYEDLALAAAAELVRGKPDAAHLDTAETLLAAVLRFHTHARKHKPTGSPFFRRDGSGWAEVGQSLLERLRDVRLRQLRLATDDGASRAQLLRAMAVVLDPSSRKTVSDGDRARVHAIGARLLSAYPAHAGVRGAVAQARVSEASLLMDSVEFDDLRLARILTDEAEAILGPKDAAVRVLRGQLTDRAKTYLRLARQSREMGNTADARTAADQAWALDPTLSELAELRRGLSGALYVGVRDWPTLMSPATARLDSERYAVELVFEGLLEEVPDPTGSRYRTATAASWPGIVPGGRDCRVRVSRPAADGTGGFDARDVSGTFRLLRDAPGSWSAVSLPWIKDLPAPPGGPAVTLAFQRGHPDPRALLTTKLLPARWLAGQNLPADDIAFARRPFGTGPYRLRGPAAGASPQELIFVSNPEYAAAGPDRLGLPRIDEIRFVDLTAVPDVTARIRGDARDTNQPCRLHILTDPTPDELKRIRSDKEIAEAVRIVRSAVNRRVYILALNHRRAPFQNISLRRGISLAINRNEILGSKYLRDAVPRDPDGQTLEMNGPFPPVTWATPKASGSLTNPKEGAVQIGAYLSIPSNPAELSLLYAGPQPGKGGELHPAEQIAQHLTAAAIEAGGRGLTIRLEAVTPQKLAERVAAGDYDMAYLPFDYPDDWYPFALAAMLDPAAASGGGRNVFGFRAPGSVPTLEDNTLGDALQAVRGSADFAGKIGPDTAKLHGLFNASVPFVPLWQLDRFIVVHKSVRLYTDDSLLEADPRTLNPSVLFHNVARWELHESGLIL